jgi:hypothetical protein
MAGLEFDIDPSDASQEFDRLPTAIRAALRKEASGLVDELLAKMRAKASGDVVQVRSGAYLESFKSQVRETAHGISAKALTSDPIAPILEHGGTQPPHQIRPKNARALHFLGNSGETFAMVVAFPGAILKPHPVVQSTFEEEQGDIVSRLEDAIEEVTKEAE